LDGSSYPRFSRLGGETVREWERNLPTLDPSEAYTAVPNVRQCLEKQAKQEEKTRPMKGLIPKREAFGL
jgi:hypothetical protein